MRKTLSKNMLALSQINYAKMEWINALWAIITNLLLIFGSKESITYIIMLVSALGHIGCLSLLVLNWFIFECIKKSKAKDFQFSIFFYIKLIFVVMAQRLMKLLINMMGEAISLLVAVE